MKERNLKRVIEDGEKELAKMILLLKIRRTNFRGYGLVWARMLACQARGHGFKSR